MTYLSTVQDVADYLGLRKRGSLTAASTTALTVSTYPFRDNRTDADAEKFAGVEFYITSGTVPVPNPNGISAYAPSTGVFTPSFTYTTPPDATAAFDMYLRGVSIADIRDAVLRALRRLRYSQLYPVSLVADPDFEASGTTDWTGANSTLTKQTAANLMIMGASGLRVVSTAAGGYAQSSSLDVPDGGVSFTVTATVRVTSTTGTARLQLWDVTAGASLATEDWEGSDWGTITVRASAPATTRSVAVRLVNVENSVTSSWDHVIAIRDGMRSWPLPSWVNDEAMVRSLVEFDTGPQPFERVIPRRHLWYDVEDDDRNPNNPMRLRFHPARSAMYFMGSRPYPVPSADADAVLIDREWITLAGAVELLRMLAVRPEGNEFWAGLFQDRLRELKRMNMNMMARPRVKYQLTEPF